jgi:hypothetical protein
MVFKVQTAHSHDCVLANHSVHFSEVNTLAKRRNSFVGRGGGVNVLCAPIDMACDVRLQVMGAIAYTGYLLLTVNNVGQASILPVVCQLVKVGAVHGLSMKASLYVNANLLTLSRKKRFE